MAILASLFRFTATGRRGGGDDVRFPKIIFKNLGVSVNAQLTADVAMSSPAYGSPCSAMLTETGESFITTGFLPSYAVFSAATPITIDGYELVFKDNVYPESVDSWQLEYSLDGGSTWVSIESQNDIVFTLNLAIAYLITASNITPPPTPAHWETLTAEELLIYDKAKMADIVADLKANVQILDDDSIFYTIGGSSAKAAAIMNVLDNGGGYPELVALNTAQTLGLSDTTLLRVLSIYLVRVDTVRYQNEAGLSLINSYARLKSFVDYLAANSIPVPSLEPTISVLRSNVETFNAARAWAATNPA